MLAGKRVALATLWDGVPDYACAVMHYCQHAQRLADVFVKGLGADSADLLMMLTKDHMYEAKTTKACRCKKTGKRFCPECPRDESSLADLETARGIVKSDCPQMKLHTLDPRLREATRRYTMNPKGGCRNKWQATCMYKWWVVSLVEYSLVILADLDVQLLRPEQPVALVTERWRRTWDYAVPSNGQPRVLAEIDHWTPFNGGLWTLGNPSKQLYEDGIVQLANGVWNETHGFNHLGTPVEHYAKRPWLQTRMTKTHMLHQNTWDFAFGDCDQGFLFHMFFLAAPLPGSGEKTRAGVDFEPYEIKPSECEKLYRNRTASADRDPRCPHTARHYWGPRKPWQLESDNAGRVAHYLAHTDYSGKTGVCAERFASWAKRLPKVDLQFYPKRFNGKVQRIR